MKKILILAGTTEGRILSDKLEEAGIKHIVSVASEYGETMMGEADFRTVRIGKLYENAMKLYLEEEGFITTVHGKGSFVNAADRQLAMEARRKSVEEELALVIDKAQAAGLTKEEIREMTEIILED